MAYVKLEHRHLGDDRWLDLSPAAFAVHVWALDHCNEQATDGAIPKARAMRLVCPVDPAELPEAWDQLVTAGLWTEGEDEYVNPEFTGHGITAEEQTATRNKWAQDKRRRRLHDIGNHQLCTPKSCRAVDNKWSQVPMSTSGQVDDQTRPDQTPKGSGVVGLPLADAAATDGGVPLVAAACSCSSPKTAVDDPSECVRCRGAVSA